MRFCDFLPTDNPLVGGWTSSGPVFGTSNRLIGDQQPADTEARTLKWDNGMLGGGPQRAGRYTFTTARDYNAQSPLQESGLLGPVTLRVASESRIE